MNVQSGGKNYSSYHSLDLSVWAGWSTPRSGRFTRRKEIRYSSSYTEGWVGPRAGLDGCGKSPPYRNSMPEP